MCAAPLPVFYGRGAYRIFVSCHFRVCVGGRIFSSVEGRFMVFSLFSALGFGCCVPCLLFYFLWFFFVIVCRLSSSCVVRAVSLSFLWPRPNLARLIWDPSSIITVSIITVNDLIIQVRSRCSAQSRQLLCRGNLLVGVEIFATYLFCKVLFFSTPLGPLIFVCVTAPRSCVSGARTLVWRGPVAGGASYPGYGSVSGAVSRSSVTCWERGHRGVRQPVGFLTASWVAGVSVVRFAGRRRGSGGSRG